MRVRKVPFASTVSGARSWRILRLATLMLYPPSARRLVYQSLRKALAACSVPIGMAARRRQSPSWSISRLV